MARLAGATIRGDRVTFSLDLEWNDDAFVEGNIWFDIHATRTPDDQNPVTVKASVYLEKPEGGRSPNLVISVAGKELFKESLANLTGENVVLDSIPGAAFGMGDPIIGCLVRAGISAAISQILSCRDHTSSHGWGIDRLKAIGCCLRENGVRMGALALWRAGRCIANG